MKQTKQKVTKRTEQVNPPRKLGHRPLDNDRYEPGRGEKPRHLPDLSSTRHRDPKRTWSA